jgi:hypothetical protein
LNATGFRGSAPPRRAFFRTRTSEKLSTLRTEDEATMLGLFRAVMPKEDRFFDLFSQHAATLVAGAKALQDLMEGGDGVEAASARVYQHEEEADEIAREVMLAVRRTFITPFDRSDIKELIRLARRRHRPDAEDRQGDRACSTSHEFEPPMREMADMSSSNARLLN